MNTSPPPPPPTPAGRRGRQILAGERHRDLRPLGLLTKYLRPRLGITLGAFLALLVGAATTLGLVQAFRLLIDRGFIKNGGGNVDIYFIALLGVAGVMAAASFVRFYLVSWLGERVVADIRRDVYDHILALSPSYFEEHRSGEIVSRVTTDTALIEQVVGSTLSIALRQTLSLIGSLAMMMYTSLRMTGVVLLAVPLILIPVIMFGRKVRASSLVSQERVGEVGAMAGESVTAIQTVQAFTREPQESRRFARVTEAAFDAARQRIRLRAIMVATVILLAFGAIDLVLWSGARDVLAGRMSGGELAAFVLYAGIIAGAVGSLSEVMADLQRASGAADRITQLLSTRPQIAAPLHPTPMAPGMSGVRFDRVTFHYPSRPTHAALQDFSLEVRPGETVALVGPSGAGKSTVFQMLLRFYDPQSGQVEVNGVDIRQADPIDLRGHMALVPQESMIFAASARDNILYGRPDAREQDVDAAIRSAAADFLYQLPQGLDTYLGERGARLSGGQKQRVAIARAILRDAPILLLDEATSALDAESEKVVQEALDHLMEGRTTLVIAHRLATVLRADRIIVMDQGRIVASGTHDSLVEQNGLYARLAQLQFAVA